ncbi:hypothetical protein SOASR030_33020 [Leminorella grimontii]|uniref:Uncharacterized protein n=1 Tax=Leminorella grimontii TaxID=82981 RepID=A0AAV5N5C3_9GAMM|nr:hypothetical protein SOASR030_33020 [Leminorella grimontii]
MTLNFLKNVYTWRLWVRPEISRGDEFSEDILNNLRRDIYFGGGWHLFFMIRKDYTKNWLKKLIIG